MPTKANKAVLRSAIRETKRTQQARETKARIYESADRLFSKKGYDHTTVAEIADAAGTSVGGFYHHFKSKEEIVLTWLSEFDLRYRSYYDEVLKGPLSVDIPVLERIRMLMVTADKAFASPGYTITRMAYALMMSDNDASDLITEPQRDFYSIIREMVNEAKSEGAIKDEHSVDDIVKQLIIINRGCMVEWLLNKGEGNLEQMNDSLLRIYLQSIAVSHGV